MIIAFSSDDEGLDGIVAYHFGRCPYYTFQTWSKTDCWSIWEDKGYDSTVIGGSEETPLSKEAERGESDEVERLKKEITHLREVIGDLNERLGKLEGEKRER